MLWWHECMREGQAAAAARYKRLLFPVVEWVCSIFGLLCCTELLFFGGVATASDRDSPATEGKFEFDAFSHG